MTMKVVSASADDLLPVSALQMTLASTKSLFFIAVAHVHSLLWQLKVSIDL